MGEIERFKRIIFSWVGNARHRKKRRTSVYENDDALLIITDLGLIMSPEALEFLSGNSTRREDFLMQLYAAEEELGVDLIEDNVRIDPRYDPRVYEEDGKIAVTVKYRDDEYIVVQYEVNA